MDSMSPSLPEHEMQGMSILAIAQVGDAVYELMVRTCLCTSQPTAVKLHKARVTCVNAQAQSLALAKILPLLTDDELDVQRRGRNAQVGTVPKSVSREIYSAATSLEAVWGYLYLTGKRDRLNQLFEVIWNEVKET